MKIVCMKTNSGVQFFRYLTRLSCMFQFLRMYRHVTMIALFCLMLGAYLVLPTITSAHEVYVLSETEVSTALASSPKPMLSTIDENFQDFVIWTLISVASVAAVFFISVLRFVEDFCNPFLVHIKQYAPVTSRVALGISLVACAIYQSNFGPELPLTHSYGAYAPFAIAILALIGVMIIAGLFARIAAALALGVYFVAAYHHGWYILSYASYVGEIFALLLVGAHRFSLDRFLLPVPKHKHLLDTISPNITPYAFMVLRVFFGISLIYSSYYAKVLHSGLALTVVEKFDMLHYFPFEPHFFVMGAAIIEILAGVFFILGFEIRFTALFLCFWLTLSLMFFGEVTWPHIILFGIPIAFIFYGYDRYSVEGYFFKTKNREPIF